MVAAKEISRGVKDVLLGASMRQVADEYRERLVEDSGFRPDEVESTTFSKDVGAYMRALARHLGDRHQGDVRVGEALATWVRFTEHYEAWDALLTGFEVDGREALIRRGRLLFPSSLTHHWDEE